MDNNGYLDPIAQAVLAIVFSYLIGSIPVGLIVARLMSGIDIREHGSGNIGLTNVIRTLGWGPGLVTGVLDFLKGYIPVYLAMTIFSAEDFAGVIGIYEAVVILVAVTIILGNMFPVYLLFRGGKGVATGLGVMSALMGVYIFIPIAVFGLILLIFRFVSLASIVAAFMVPVTVLLFHNKIDFTSADASSAYGILLIFTIVVASMIIWRHKTNIQRIIAGTESRIGKSKDPTLDTMKERIARQSLKETESVGEKFDTPETSPGNQSTEKAE